MTYKKLVILRLKPFEELFFLDEKNAKISAVNVSFNFIYK